MTSNVECGGRVRADSVSYRSGLLVVAAMVAALLAWPGAGEAQVDLSGPTSTLIGTLLGTTTSLADTGILAAGTSDVLDASSLTGGVGSLVAGEVLHAVTIGYPDQIDSEASLAALALNVAGTNIGADFVMARAMAVVGGASGVSNIDGLSIDGVPIPVTGDPNQTIGIPGGVLTINEQQVAADGTLVVNALHAVVSGVADVVVGSAMAGASGGNAKAVQATSF